MRTRKPNSDALYVHIPFCWHLCHYCDFTKRLYDAKVASAYVEALMEEIASYGIGKLSTIYVGGGTPTALNEEQMEKLLSALSAHRKPRCEFTLEANVENLTEAKLALMRRYGVNRLSIGVQTFSDSMLTKMNRFHRGIDAKKAVFMAKKAGFKRISVDLMYGLPGETLEDVTHDLHEVLSLGVGHISTYALSVVPGTLFFRHQVSEASQEVARDQYDLILKTLREAGYQRYEVSNFALPGQQARHNHVYWDDRPYYGVGLGASGYLGTLRYVNTTNMNDYLSGKYVKEKETITPEVDENDFLMLKLRLEEGFAFAEFQTRFHASFLEKYQTETQNLVGWGLLKLSETGVACTDEGLMLLDTVLLKLYKR